MAEGEAERKGGIEMRGRNRRAGGQHGVELRVNVAMSICLLGGRGRNGSGVARVCIPEKEVQQNLS